MKNDNRPVIFGVGAVTILLLSYFIMTYNPERYDWSETYETENTEEKVKKPYDISIIHQMLNTYFPEKEMKTIEESLVNTLPLEEGTHANYVFIGKRPYYDSVKLDRILDFAGIGNSVFISSRSLPKGLMTKIKEVHCGQDVEEQNYDFDEVGNLFDERLSGGGYQKFADTSTWVNYSHNDLYIDKPISYKYKHRYGKQLYYWDYFDEDAFCNGMLDYAELSFLEPHRVNFIKVPYLRGFVYLHTTPLMFTDVQMVREEAYASAGKVFSHLPEGDIYWDNVSRVQAGEGNFPGRNSDWTPYQYMLSQPALKWAWYTLLAMFGFYLLFRAKRKQRVIPVLEKNTNTSLEFIKTVGRLYFLQNDHRKLAGQKMKLFLAYVRDHYSIPTQNIDSDMKQRLANKSEIPLKLIEEIFSRYQRIQRAPDVSTTHLVNFHFAVEDFYKKSK